MNEIIPMSKEEIRKLDLVILDIKSKFRKSIEDRMVSNSFASAYILNYDNDIILVEVRYGVSIAIPELCFKTIEKIDRHSMEPIEEKEFYA